MTTEFNYPSTSAASFWHMPVLYFVVCCIANYFTGALDYQLINDFRAQRDFNAALGMPLLTTFFWISLRIQQQQMAGAIMSYLLDKNALSLFAQHRARLAVKLRHHILTSATLAISMTAVYIMSEELVAFDMNMQVLVLDLIAVPFWFFFWLFLFQMIYSTHYMMKHFIHINIATSSELKALKRVSLLSMENALFSITALIIIPVFWFKKDIPAIDLAIVTLFSSSLTVYLIMPAVKVYRLIGARKQKIMDQLTRGLTSIYCEDESDRINHERRNAIQQEIEEVENITATPVTFEQCKRMLSVVFLIPASWMTLIYIEHLVT